MADVDFSPIANMKPFRLGDAVTAGQTMASNQYRLNDQREQVAAKEGLRGALQAGTPQAMQAFSQQHPEAARAHKAADVELQGKQLSFMLSRLNYVDHIMSGVSDDTSYQAALPQVQQAGVDVKDFPPNFDPNFIEQRRKQALGFKGQAEMKLKELELELKKKTANNGRGEYVVPVQTANGVLGFDTRKGMYVDPTTGKHIQGGKPVVGSTSDPNLQKKISSAKEEGKTIGESIATIGGKYDALESVREAKKILEKGIYSGALAELRKGTAKLNPLADKTKAANTEEFISHIGNVVVPRLKEFGGNDSNEEMRYLQKIMGGDITMEPEALLKVIESAEKKIASGIKRLREQAAQTGSTPASAPTNRVRVDEQGNVRD